MYNARISHIQQRRRYGYFGEDTIGYGHPELKMPAVNVDSTSFFASLGETREERAEVFERMAHERIVYRRDLFKALQTALRDIRAYEYDVENNKWRLYDKKKRARPNDDCLTVRP
ncbi:unnamed protein product [Cylicocyclus nassatus]|uniref:Uncharacterized protein n=1 Tax=Cylicocyclus nassatus TaxID=53992 RepID=A0AA36H3E5_CYLNA|nr:unnamed protein product [Cylicocyclus nassatus]